MAVLDKYPVGTRVKLIEMIDEEYPVEPGTLGTITGINGVDDLTVIWDNGRTLGLIVGVDKFEVVK